MQVYALALGLLALYAAEILLGVVVVVFAAWMIVRLWRRRLHVVILFALGVMYATDASAQFAGWGCLGCDLGNVTPIPPPVIVPPSTTVQSFTFNPADVAAWGGVLLEPTILPNLGSASLPCFASPTGWTTAAIYTALDPATLQPALPPFFVSQCRVCETPVPVLNADGTQAIDGATGLPLFDNDCGKKVPLPLEFKWRPTTGTGGPGSGADENVSIRFNPATEKLEVHENGGGADAGLQP